MATFILVHGASVGGWVWSRIAPDLRARGHTVFTPTLTGLGERDHLLDSDVDCELHATDLEKLVDYEGVSRAIWVGHGYGCAVIQRVAARLPARIGRVILLDPLLSAAGQSLDATFGAAGDLLRSRAYDDDGLLLYPPDPGLLLAGLSKRDADWVEERLGPMPVAPFTQVLPFDPLLTLGRPLLAVRLSHGDLLAATGLALVAAAGIAVAEITGPSLVMLAKPEPTAELLDNMARQPAELFVAQDN